MNYVYRCPICKVNIKQPIQPHQPPMCRGPEKTHNKEMTFVPELSDATPDYIKEKKK